MAKPAQNQSLSKLVKTYEMAERAPLAKADMTLKERSPKDPFGKSEEADRDTSMELAKRVAVKCVQFFGVISREYGLTNEQQIFVAELTALNILNAEDCPMKPAEVMAVRKKAFEYYKEALQDIPDPPKRK